jgi:hypothetical protein
MSGGVLRQRRRRADQNRARHGRAEAALKAKSRYFDIFASFFDFNHDSRSAPRWG